MNRQFAALRGIAIVLVVLHHAVDLTAMVGERVGAAPLSGAGAAVVTFFYELGIVAVPLFLFISGAFMSYAARGNPPRLSWQVTWNGIRRIFWPYLLWSAVLYVDVFLHYGEVYTPVEYVKKLIVGSPFHFVPLLLFFYLASPLLVRFVQGRRGLLLVIGAGLLQLFIMNVQAPGILGFRYPGWMPDNIPLLGNSLAQYAVYFPLGMAYSFNAARINPILARWRWPLWAGTLALFGIHLLHAYGAIRLPIVQYVAATLAMFVTPLISRRSIAGVRTFELVGKRSYGLYLIHFTLIDALLFAVSAVTPGLLSAQLLLIPIMFVLGAGLPMLAMERLARLRRARGVYQFVFG